MLALALVLATGLASCGRKPNRLQPPGDDAQTQFPKTYPKPTPMPAPTP